MDFGNLPVQKGCLKGALGRRTANARKLGLEKVMLCLKNGALGMVRA